MVVTVLHPLRNRMILGLLLVLGVATQGAARAAESPSRSVLFVVSSEGRSGGAVRPGFEMDELSQAWAIFRDNGIKTTFASPRGGAVEADKYDPADPENARFLAHPEAVAQLRSSVSLSQVKAADFDAIYVIGGKGAMFDLARNPALARLIADAYEQGRVIAAICHGSAALAQVRLADGRSLVDGRAVTGFSAEEEALFGKRWASEFPFPLEDTLRRHGARWIESPVMMPGVAVDGRLVTGQNPYSTGPVVDAVMRAMGIEPIGRAPRRDEASLALLERAVRGDATAHAALASAPDRYRPELIAIIGHYQLQAARDPDAVRAALAAMDLAAPHFHAHELSVSRADAMQRLGHPDEARRLLDAVLAAQPDMPEALALRRRLTAPQ